MARTKALKGGRRPLPCSIRLLSDVECAWIGAMIEGEGCLTHEPRKTSFGWRLIVCSTAVETIATLLRLVGAGTINARPSRYPHAKPQWVWSLNKQNDVRALLKNILPYLTDKKKLAQEVLKKEYRHAITY